MIKLAFFKNLDKTYREAALKQKIRTHFTHQIRKLSIMLYQMTVTEQKIRFLRTIHLISVQTLWP